MESLEVGPVWSADRHLCRSTVELSITYRLTSAPLGMKMGAPSQDLGRL
jgi:hypothetical protein